jgi:hypothetical protein
MTSESNVLFTFGTGPISMSAPAGTVFSVATLDATAAWADNVTAVFTGFDAQGMQVGQVNVTVNQSGPLLVDLSSLGFISRLTMDTFGCGDNVANTCYSADQQCTNIFTPPIFRTFLVVDDIVVTRRECVDARLCNGTLSIVTQLTSQTCMRSPILKKISLCHPLPQDALAHLPTQAPATCDTALRGAVHH